MKRIMNDELLQQLTKHEGEWVALIGPDDRMQIVGSGNDAAEASEQGAKKGYTETILFKVLPSEVAYIPMA